MLLAPALAGLAVLWLGPFAHWAENTFTGHMVLHMGIVTGVAPALVLGAPVLQRVLGRIAPPVLMASLATVVEFLVVWGWHTPALCGAARTSTLAFVAEQASWVFVGVFLWSAVLGNRRDRGASLWAGVLALLVTGMHMTLLGTLITLSRFETYGLPLADQQIGGIVMLAVGGVVYTGAGLTLAFRGLSEPEDAPLSGSPRQHPNECVADVRGLGQIREAGDGHAGAGMTDAECFLCKGVFPIGPSADGVRLVPVWHIKVCRRCYQENANGLAPQQFPRVLRHLTEQQIPFRLNSLLRLAWPVVTGPDDPSDPPAPRPQRYL